MEVDGVRFIDLKTVKASKSFVALYRLLKQEKPHTVFSTTAHINILVSMVAIFIKGTRFIARASNIASELIQYEDTKTRFYEFFTRFSYGVFSQIVCQTKDMQDALVKRYALDANKTTVIHNPLLDTDKIKAENIADTKFRLVVVARFSPEKGLERLIDILAELPPNYSLSMVGIGVQKELITRKIEALNLTSRVEFYGEVRDVQQIMLDHDLLVLSSYTEGFPNVVIEALAVGLPVVSFKVSGIQEIIKEGFNGYIVPQNNLSSFKEKIVEACTNRTWNSQDIKADVYYKFNLNKISKAYEQLIN